MKIIQKDFHISTRNRNQMIDITGQVESAAEESGVKDGDVIIYCLHTTAAITINENADPTVPQDILLTLEELAPHSNSAIGISRAIRMPTARAPWSGAASRS